MNIDRYISAREKESIKIEYAQKIMQYADIQMNLRAWYDEYGLEYPDSSINNFRDSWYHFRKMWPEHSYVEIVNQLATLDEHLQRAEKDAVVNFFQIISQNLEFWYLSHSIPVDKIVAEKFDDGDLIGESEIDLYDAGWLRRCWEYFRDDEFLASQAVVYAVQTYLAKKTEYFKEMQILLHQLKNCILHIRMNSSDITRLNQPGEYLEKAKSVYDMLDEFFAKDAYSYLFGIQDLVRVNIEYSDR